MEINGGVMVIADRKYKTIISASLARFLIQRGFIVRDIKPNSRDSRRTVFIFDNNSELIKEIDIYTNK